MAPDPLLIARPDPARGGADACLLPALANRHGLITGATGTGKTVTLQRIAEACSAIGVPLLLADVKGDLSGLAAPGTERPAFAERRARLGLPPEPFAAVPVAFWDVFGDQGHPLRATVSDLGPLLLARLLGCNDTQQGVLSLAFRLADEEGLLLLDLADLRALLRYVGENARSLQTTYGNVSPASIGAIQRGLLALESQGGECFFGEPALDVNDLLRTDAAGRGVVNVLAADRLVASPSLYATVLLWLLSELQERLPEVGDPEKPRLVLVFDEAHLLLAGAPTVLIERVEQVARLIRSKGVSLWFCSQSPQDLPPRLLAQLGNRVQHALRAYTPAEQKVVKAAATSFRPNPVLDVAAAIGELAVGEVLVSFLQADGTPAVVERALVVPPLSRVGVLEPAERRQHIEVSPLEARYRRAVDRDSAHELLERRAAAAAAGAEQEARPRALARRESAERLRDLRAEERERQRAEVRSARERDRLLLSLAGEAGQALGGRTGRSLARGILGGLLRRG